MRVERVGAWHRSRTLEGSWQLRILPTWSAATSPLAVLPSALTAAIASLGVSAVPSVALRSMVVMPSSPVSSERSVRDT